MLDSSADVGGTGQGPTPMELVLMALGGKVTILGPKGERSLALEDLLTGYYETALEKNELIAHVDVPAQGARKASYMKVTTGSADDWPALGVAAVIEAEGNTIKSARVVASAATAMATRLKSAEAVLNGKSVTDKLLKDAGDAAAEEAVARYAQKGVNRDLALRTYTTRLLGGVPKLVLHGGGNTSVKTRMKDTLGEEVDVLCVKGSGWDMGSIGGIGLGAMQMAGRGYERGWGLGRHVLGSNYFHYVRDPWGSFAEYTADMDYVPVDEDWSAGVHDAEDSFYLWANAPPDDFARNYEIE